VKDVFRISNAYTSQVGSGPFSSELFAAVGETMVKVGTEFCSVISRSRCCGWLDLVALKYAGEVNGVTDLYMIKGDVLSGYDTLKVCTAYSYKDEEIDHLPYNIEAENVQPIYVEKKGWKQDLTGLTSYDKLPGELKEYIEFIEEYVGVPIKVISVGPDRKQTIMK